MKRGLIFILFIPFISFSQNGDKKHKYEKVFLNEYLEPTDSVKSVFYGYELIIKNRKSRIFNNKKKKFKKEGKLFCNTSIKKGYPILLSDTIWFKDKNNRIMQMDIYEKGFPKYFYSYHKKIGYPLVNEFLDFTKLYNNEIGTFYFTYSNYKGVEVARFWYRNGEKGWKAYCIDKKKGVVFL